MGNTLLVGGHFYKQVPSRQPEPQILFERLYREFGPEVLAFCRRRATPDIADDATAETFLVVWRRLSDVPRAPRGWLLGIARLTLANHRRGVKRRQALIERIGWEQGEQPDPAEAHSIFQALSRLSEADQEALLLSAWDGLNSREAGKVLGCTPAAFRLRLHRARRRLERALVEEPLERHFQFPREQPT